MCFLKPKKKKNAFQNTSPRQNQTPIYKTHHRPDGRKATLLFDRCLREPLATKEMARTVLLAAAVSLLLYARGGLAQAPLNLSACGITGDSPWSRVPGCQCEANFAFDGCRDEAPHLVCSGLSEVPIHLPPLNVSCLVIQDSPEFTELRPEHLQQFPAIQGLLIRNTMLTRVLPGTFNFSPLLSHIFMPNNHLVEMPPISNLCSLLHVNFVDNEIEDFQPHHWENSYNIINADVSHNRIRRLVNGHFANKCILGQFRISHNPLTVIEPTAFSGSAISLLDVGFTKLKDIPFDDLRLYLLELYINGTDSFSTFSPILPDNNLTFPLLRRVEFSYTAHCCQLKGRRFLDFRRLSFDRKRSLSSDRAFQRVDEGSKLDGNGVLLPYDFHESSKSLRRQARQVVRNVCVNITSLACIDPSSIDASLTTPVTINHFCSSFDLCDACLEGVCPNSCSNSSAEVGSGSGVLSSDSEVICVEVTSEPPTDAMPTSTAATTGPVCEDTLMIVNRTKCVGYCAPNSAYCSTFFTGFIGDICKNCFDTGCQTGQDCAGFFGEEICTCQFGSPSQEIRCETKEVYALCNNCTTTTPETTPTVPGTTPTGDTIGPFGCTCDGTNDQDNCNGCLDTECVMDFCSFAFTAVCNCIANSRKKRSIYEAQVEYETRSKRFAAGEQFFPDPNPQDLTCIEVESPTTGPSPTSSGAVGGCLIRECIPPFDLSRLVESDEDTVCLPEVGPFNPCINLLGESDFLRAAIWLVILVAVLLNIMVICVFLGYTCGIRRMKQDFFIVHFFYFNLAISDLLMGVYLFAIAIVDLNTLDDFFASDIVWRIRGGCDFAGMCAIVSTVVSVYVLVVITIERTVTITNVMKRRKISRAMGFIIMFFGWVFGIIMGFLPITGISSYRQVAICLPFDVRDPEDLGYVFFLLLATGLAFLVIAISYIVIFYKVFCSKEKRKLQSSASKWKTELKVALRMSLLIITNFACWFPIALLGSTAAFGKPLVTNIEFAKVVMVFVFPLNAMLNPVLYSLSTRIFRENIILLFFKCGLCKRHGMDIRNRRAGITPSVTSARSGPPSTSGPVPLRPMRRRGTLMERLLSLSSLGSSGDLTTRRGSTISQDSNSNEGFKTYFINAFKRRGSNFSGNSYEESPLARNSRRSSTFSGSSSEDQATTTFANVGFRPNSPGGRDARENNVPSSSKVPVRPKISNSSLGGLPSLGAVPEESELVAPGGFGDGAVKINPAYVEETDDSEITIVPRQNGIIQHSVVQLNSESSSNEYRDSDTITEDEQNEDDQSTTVCQNVNASEENDSSLHSASVPHSISSSSLEQNEPSDAVLVETSVTVTIDFD